MNQPTGQIYDNQWGALAGWFLGPRAENRFIFNDLMMRVLNWHEDCREKVFPADPCYFTEEFKHSEAAKAEYKDLEDRLLEMHEQLKKSIPLFSPRYQGHMVFDQTMPSLLGYVSGLLWNQNNVDSTASPVTSQFEVEVAKQLCNLMRFKTEETELVDDKQKPIAWGHLTGCGSVANIEAMWAARNTKLYPLALQAACKDPSFPDISAGGDTFVYVPGRGSTVQLCDCSTWDLLNLEIDAICKLTYKVVDHIHFVKHGKMSKETIKKIVDQALEAHSLVHIGLPEFFRRHGIGVPSEVDGKTLTYPRVYSPGTNHYSWPKSSTILGIGDKNIFSIPVDGKARQNIVVLRSRLDEALKHKIPILMVVAVIGSTEESSVDDLEQIILIRDEYAVKGLTFSLHVDSAWGGYLNCMTHGNNENDTTKVSSNGIKGVHDYVPIIPLSEYVKAQYISMKNADTITVDPHKSGLCPYPAGALLYRNGTMKEFITFLAPEIFHDPNDFNIGLYGLEGSKPGAAAASVLLSHKVIGLDNHGYGRIFGQSQLGAKLFYSLWETVAKDKDPFICVNFIKLDFEELQKEGFDFKTEECVRKYIKKHILGIENSVLDENNHREMDFLKFIGPDTLINTFVINCKDKEGNPQSNIQLTNDLQTLIFNELSVSVNEDTKRVKMFLTKSEYELKNYGAALIQLKERLGLPTEDGNEDSLKFLRNTCIGPYQAREFYVTFVGEVFRDTVLNCIGALDSIKYPDYGDPLEHHTFLVVNDMRDDGKVFLDFVPTFAKKSGQYQCVFRIIINKDSRTSFRLAQQKHRGPLFLRTIKSVKLFDFVKKSKDMQHEVALYTKVDDFSSSPILTDIKIRIDEVWEFRHFETPEYAAYKEKQTYFLFGDDKEAFLSHIIKKQMDFYQVIKLDCLPHSVPPELLELGINITLNDDSVHGYPLVVDGKIINPLVQRSYRGDYRGKQYAKCVTSLLMSNPETATLYFDYLYLNGISKETVVEPIISGN